MRGEYRRVNAGVTSGSIARARSHRARPDVNGRIRAGFWDGDPEAVRVVYRAYGSLVYAVAFRVLGDRGLCEEATQQTFLRAWRGAAGFEASRELGPWLVRIARRVAIDLYRREAIRPAAPLESVAADDPALVAESATDALPEVWEVRRAVWQLPAEQREVVRLQHFEGFTHEQIAVRLGVPAGTVKSRSHRAHRRLALELGHLRDGNPSLTLRVADPADGEWPAGPGWRPVLRSLA
ncbi:MAG: sigma-70 family RNA polymerase sigma factor [Solirubrobacterales bacterium]|nr:sigma-70 family RNA polymerase sigma factor [Solirubrobacterales bacterium]